MSPILTYTPLDEISQIHASLHSAFQNGNGKLASVKYRKDQLLSLCHLIKDNWERFQDSLAQDMGRPAFEADMYDTAAFLTEAVTAYSNVESWAKPSKGPFDFNWYPFGPTIRKEPVGVVLIIAPFNFPLWTLAPVASAIAAGCPALLKPSELTPATSALLTELLPKYLDPDLYRIVNGSVQETTKVLELKWDHILYTGSGRVGRIIATAAAQHLTPCTLELGGKSPVFIDPNMDLKLAARRILWGKCINAGQICLAPDYVLVPESVRDRFVLALKEVYTSFFPGPEGPKKAGAVSRIITPGHYSRLKGYLDETKGEIVLGGETDPTDNYIAPTVVQDVPFDDALMRDELFGPILPLITVQDVEESLQFVNTRERPLALYVFSNNAKFRAHVLDNTLSGAAFINDVCMQGGCLTVPFGGSGASGYGYHKGKYGFDTFTHMRASFASPSWIDAVVGFRFPPYTEKKAKAMRKALAPAIPSPHAGLGKAALISALVATGAGVAYWSTQI